MERVDELGPFISNYYKSLLVSSTCPINVELLRHVPEYVAQDMNDMRKS